MDLEINDLFKLLISVRKLERDKSFDLLESHVDNLDYLRMFYVKLKSELVNVKNSKWQFSYGLLNGFKYLVAFIDCLDEEFELFIKDCLNDAAETRVRLAAGELLGELCKKFSHLYANYEDYLLNLIKFYINGDLKRREAKQKYLNERKNVENDSDDSSDSDLTSNNSSDSDDCVDQDESDCIESYDGDDLKILRKLSVNKFVNKAKTNATKLYRLMAGWRHLETSMRALQRCIDGHTCFLLVQNNSDSSIDYGSFLNLSCLLNIINDTIVNRNRYVRETTFDLLKSILSSKLIIMSNINNIEFNRNICNYLANGLSDNWSQVRMAACMATRNYLLNLNSNFLNNTEYMTILVPPLCFNRYFMAEGVKKYSQETWLLIFNDQGRLYVGKYLKYVFDYYIKQITSDNAAIRETTCLCLSELCLKIDIKEYVNRFVHVLIECFNGQSWTVRDAACVALGNLFECYLNELFDDIDKINELFMRNLHDSIKTVREGAAISIKSLLKALVNKYTESNNEQIYMNKIKYLLELYENECLTCLNGQTSNFLIQPTPEISNTRHHRRHIKKKKSHVNTCEDDIGNIKEGKNEIWHYFDGYLHLLHQLSTLPQTITLIKGFLSKWLSKDLLSMLKMRSYDQHVQLLQTFCQLFVLIGRNIGKNEFKSNLENYFETLFYAYDCDYEPTSNSASECLIEISKFIGPNILIGRLENYDSRLVPKLQMILKTNCAGLINVHRN